MDGLLRAAWEERGAGLPLLRHQPPDVLPLAETLPLTPHRQPGGALASAPPGAATDLVAGAGRGGAGVARAISSLGQGQAGAAAARGRLDGGSEFQAHFERACQEHGIRPDGRPSGRLFVLPPRSPKLNGSVERAQRTHPEEFYEVWDLPWTVTPLNRKLRAWERIYNTVRPHQSLGYRTPREYLRELAHAGKG